MLARLGRAFGVYEPEAQVRVDAFFESRPGWASHAGLWMYYGLAVASIAGLVVLRQRGLTSFPMTTWVANVALTAIVFYGTTRFRAAAEPVFVVLGAIGVDAVLRWLRPGDDRSAGGDLSCSSGC